MTLSIFSAVFQLQSTQITPLFTQSLTASSMETYSLESAPFTSQREVRVLSYYDQGESAFYPDL